MFEVDCRASITLTAYGDLLQNKELWTAAFGNEAWREVLEDEHKEREKNAKPGKEKN